MEKLKRSNWTGVKLTGIFALLLFAGVSASVIANRLSNEALAVLAGSVCGVGAAIPTSLIIVFVVNRRNGQSETRRVPQLPQNGNGNSPVVVIAPPGSQYQQQLPPATWDQAPPIARRYTVVGEEGEW